MGSPVEVVALPPAVAGHTLALMLGMPPAEHPEWRPAFALADAWDYAAGLCELAGDYTRAERYRRRADEIYDLLETRCQAADPGA